ncbi:latent-transforming growth factor beta-binding protein 4 isoform X2 [Scyliorhinus torazame]
MVTDIQLVTNRATTPPQTQPVPALSIVRLRKKEKRERATGKKTPSTRYIGRKKSTVRWQPLTVKQAQSVLLRKLALSSQHSVKVTKSHLSPPSDATPNTKSRGPKANPRVSGRSQPRVKQTNIKVLCLLRCQNGGVCVRKDRCLCPSGFTGKFCQISTLSASSQLTVSSPTGEPDHQAQVETVYTLPLSNQQHPNQTGRLIPSIVNLRVHHPPEVSINVHQVTQVDGETRTNSAQLDVHQPTAQRALQQQLGPLTATPRLDAESVFGYCFTEITNGQCSLPLAGLRTLERCCRGGGVGWGVTECLQCPVTPGNDCPRGFEKTVDGKCEDINECSLPGICQNAKCLNVRGSYSCVCSRGFVQDTSKSRCISQQVISLTKGPCYRIWRSGTCSLPVVRNITKQICCCSRVGKAWGPDCQKCPSPLTEGFRDICPAGSGYHYIRSDLRYNNRITGERGRGIANVDQAPRTTSTPHSQPTEAPRLTETTRAVSTSRTSTALPRTPRPAPEIDVCHRLPQICGPGRCVIRPQGYTCACNTGFQLNAHQSRCVDTDECELRPLPCSNGQCVNSVGSFHCACSRGFSANSHRTDCVDTDECELRPLPCSNGQCVNSVGSFHCACSRGFSANSHRTDCVDTDECELRPLPCSNGQCVNSVGSFHCACSRGFSANSHRTDCVDINECLDVSSCPNSECVNSVGSFRCLPCPTGYQIHNRKCSDIDECLNGTTCGDAGTCVNTEGSYRCDCNLGYRLSAGGNRCADINECFEGDFCAPYGECLNSVGSYTCLCAEGFTTSADLSTCLDVDECTRTGVCDRGHCTNAVGSFECSCDPGFRVDEERSRCFDLDECVEYPTICGSKRCENNAGSFQCITDCTTGFQLSPAQDCIDIDECVNATICGPNAYCQNVAASFQCLCDQGYQMTSDGSRCVDVNECEAIQGVCGSAVCENVGGSFFCLCPDENEEFEPRTGRCIRRVVQGRPMYLGESPREENECYYNLNDAQLCENILAKNVTRQECCCTVGEGWGRECKIYQCPVPGSDEYRTLCPRGQGFLSIPQSSFGRNYKDADECSLFGSELCKNGVCVNTVPGYACYCPTGYYYHSIRLECIDNNECEDEAACENGDCVNTVGSYYCSCHPPLILDVTLRRCISNSSERFDVHMALCWQEVGLNLLCKRLYLARMTTYTECCCQFGEGWGMDCALCPTRNTEYHNELCNYLTVPLSEDESYSQGLEYENYGLQIGAEFTPDSLDPRGYNPNPPQLGDGRDYRPPDGEPFRAQDPPPRRPVYDSRQLRSGPEYRGESRPSRIRHQPRTRQTGQGYRTRSIHAGVAESESSQPWPRYQHRDPAPDIPEFHSPNLPLLVSSNEEYLNQFQRYEGFQPEECGILNGCVNGECIRVPEGFTCDCHDGYQLDMTKMACVDINECDEVDDPKTLCRNAQCTNTDGSYRCICLRGYVLSRRPNYCVSVQRRAGL